MPKNEVTNYLSEIKDGRKTKNTTLKIIERAEAGKIEVLNKDNPQPWQKQLLTALTTLNRYISEKLESIEKNEHFNKAIPPRIYNALEAINSEKSQDILNATQTRTPWEKVFNEFEEYKNGNKGTKQNTIDSNRFCVLTCFELVNKKYVEEITYKDCHKIAIFLLDWPKFVPLKKSEFPMHRYCRRFCPETSQLHLFLPFFR